jgi:hypothetical protein
MVIDFVGNHRMFLDRIRRLLSLVASPTSLHAFFTSNAPPELPPGCSVELELEAKELLQTFLPRGALEVERVYRELVLTRGERPTADELFRMGYRPDTVRPTHGGWSALSPRKATSTPTRRERSRPSAGGSRSSKRAP